MLAALSVYTFDKRKAGATDFTPTAVLYQAYLEFARQFVTDDAPPLMNATQFGVALNRVFKLDPGRHTLRTYGGKKLTGYQHVRGPGSVVTQPPRRPRAA